MRNVPLLISHLDLSIAPTIVILLHQALLYHVTGWSPSDGTATEWLHAVDGRGQGGNADGNSRLCVSSSEFKFERGAGDVLSA